MENPEHDIRAVVRSLCQGTPKEQRRTLDRYFTKDASFVHPFCAVPHFSSTGIPLLGRLSSRDVVRSIFQWYRIMSPKIEIEIDSALHDRARDKMYVDIRQVFSVWFIPFYHARVRLVTVLDLVESGTPDYHDPLDRMSRHEDGREETSDRHDGSGGSHRHGHGSWKISKQEDLYQVNDFLRFLGGPGPFSFMWYLFQLGASAACVFLSLLLFFTPWAYQNEPARGGVEASIDLLESPGASTSSFSDREREGYDRNGTLGVDGGPVGGEGEGGSSLQSQTNGQQSGLTNGKSYSAALKKSRKGASNGRKVAAI